MRNNAPAAKYVVVDHLIDGIQKLAKVKNVVLESSETISTQPSTSAVISERNSNSDDLPNVALLERKKRSLQLVFKRILLLWRFSMIQMK